MSPDQPGGFPEVGNRTAASPAARLGLFLLAAYAIFAVWNIALWHPARPATTTSAGTILRAVILYVDWIISIMSLLYYRERNFSLILGIP